MSDRATIGRLRYRLLKNAGLFAPHADAYEAGVNDALDEVHDLLDHHRCCLHDDTFDLSKGVDRRSHERA